MDHDKVLRLRELFDWIYKTDENLYKYLIDCMDRNNKGLLSEVDISEFNDMLMYKQAELMVSKFACFNEVKPVEIECSVTPTMNGGRLFSDSHENKWARYFNVYSLL